MKALFDFLLEHHLTLTITPRRYCNYDDKKFAAVVHGDPECNEAIIDVLAGITEGGEEGVKTESFLFYSGYPAVPFGCVTDLGNLYTKIQEAIAKLDADNGDGHGYGGWEYGIYHAMAKAGKDSDNIDQVDFFKTCKEYWGQA